MSDAIAYKVLTASEWARFEADGVFTGAPVDVADGFIHLSTAAQITETVDKHFAGASGLWVAAIDLTALGQAVKWEPSRGGALFPHVYAPLPMAAVVASAPLTRDATGAVVVPGER